MERVYNAHRAAVKTKMHQFTDQGLRLVTVYRAKNYLSGIGTRSSYLRATCIQTSCTFSGSAGIDFLEEVSLILKRLAIIFEHSDENQFSAIAISSGPFLSLFFSTHTVDVIVVYVVFYSFQSSMRTLL